MVQCLSLRRLHFGSIMFSTMMENLQLLVLDDLEGLSECPRSLGWMSITT